MIGLSKIPSICVLAIAAAMPATAQLHSWEGTDEGFSNIDAIVHVNDADPASAVTDGNYAARVDSLAVTRYLEGLFTTDLLAPLSNNTTLQVDFARSTGDYQSFHDFTVSLSIDGLYTDDTGFFRIEQVIPSRMISGTSEFEYASHPDLATLLSRDKFRLRIRIDRYGGGGNTASVYIDNLRISSSAPLTGDLNGDGFVGQDDLNIVLGAWGTNVTPGDPLAGDPSGDGFVGQDDLNDILSGWGQGTPPSGLSLIPEPASAALVTLGGLALLRRRRV